MFNGKVYVDPIAQKTDGKQTNHALLLSEHARVDTKPQLEIFADDVKCTHGATVGRLDEGALFYMKSRGIGAEYARALLTYAFAAEVLETIEVDVLREGRDKQVFARFSVFGSALKGAGGTMNVELGELYQSICLDHWTVVRGGIRTMPEARSAGAGRREPDVRRSADGVAEDEWRSGGGCFVPGIGLCDLEGECEFDDAGGEGKDAC